MATRGKYGSRQQPEDRIGSFRSSRKRAADKQSDADAVAATQPLRRFLRNFRWETVEPEPYKLSAHRGGQFRGASRHVLIGKNREPVNFHLRYFELEPGGFTSLERHRHCHVIIGARGKGRVKIGGIDYAIAPMDIVYIAPDEPHQLSANARGRFGFFCIVDAVRDKPRPASD